MDIDANRVIAAKSGISATTTTVYHRDFAEIRAEGTSPRDAARHLVNKLTGALDTALTDWRRASVDGAIADVKAYVEREESSEA